MKFEVKANLQYYIHSPSTLIINVHALRTPHQSVLQETFTIDPYMKVEELIAILQRQNVNLRETRDLLLPRLLSGQLSLVEINSSQVTAAAH